MSGSGVASGIRLSASGGRAAASAWSMPAAGLCLGQANTNTLPPFPPSTRESRQQGTSQRARLKEPAAAMRTAAGRRLLQIFVGGPPACACHLPSFILPAQVSLHLWQDLDAPQTLPEQSRSGAGKAAARRTPRACSASCGSGWHPTQMIAAAGILPPGGGGGARLALAGCLPANALACRNSTRWVPCWRRHPCRCRTANRAAAASDALGLQLAAALWLVLICHKTLLQERLPCECWWGRWCIVVPGPFGRARQALRRRTAIRPPPGRGGAACRNVQRIHPGGGAAGQAHASAVCQPPRDDSLPHHSARHPDDDRWRRAARAPFAPRCLIPPLHAWPRRAMRRHLLRCCASGATSGCSGVPGSLPTLAMQRCMAAPTSSNTTTAPRSSCWRSLLSTTVGCGGIASTLLPACQRLRGALRCRRRRPPTSLPLGVTTARHNCTPCHVRHRCGWCSWLSMHACPRASTPSSSLRWRSFP